MQEIVVNSAKLHDFAQTLCEKAGLRRRRRRDDRETSGANRFARCAFTRHTRLAGVPQPRS